MIAQLLPLVAVLCLVSFGCGTPLAQFVNRANLAQNLGDKDGARLTRSCQIALAQVKDSPTEVIVEGLCQKGLSDFDRFEEDLAKLKKAVGEDAGADVIEGLVLAVEEDEAEISKDIDEIAKLITP